MEEQMIILEENSPICDIQAFVEKSAQHYYFYLWLFPGKEYAQMKSCWICNRQAAPDQLDMDAMQKGMAPMMPAEFVAHDLRGMELDENALEIVWFEEGDAAALLCQGEVVCVIPAWSGYQGFHGYSLYAKGTGPCGWEYAQAQPVLNQRVKRSRDFWAYCDTNYWHDIQQTHLELLETFFGPYKKYYALDGGHFPAKALITGIRDGVSYGITLGVSLLAMPCAEQAFGDIVGEHRRIELGFATTLQNDDLCNTMYSTLSGLTGYPWRELTFLAHGHTVPFSRLEGYVALLLIDPLEVPGLEAPQYPLFRGDSIRFHWVVPVDNATYQLLQEEGVDAWIQKRDKKERVHILE